MKIQWSVPFKFALSMALAWAMVLVLWAASWFVWGKHVFQSELESNLAGYEQRISFQLEKSKDSTHPDSLIQGLLHEISSQNFVASAAVLDKNNQHVLAQEGRRTPVLSLATRHLVPLRAPGKAGQDGSVVAWLQVWYSPEIFLRRLFFMRWSDWVVAVGLALAGFMLVSHFLAQGLIFRPLADVISDDGPGAPFVKLKRQWAESKAALALAVNTARSAGARMTSETLTGAFVEKLKDGWPDLSCLILLEEPNGKLRCEAQMGFATELTESSPETLRDGPVGHVLRSGESLVLSGRESASFVQALGSLVALGACALVPIKSESFVRGALVLGSLNEGFFEPDRLSLFGSLAEYLANLLQYQQYEENMEELNRTLESGMALASRELSQTNNRLIQKVQELKTFYEVALETAAERELGKAVRLIVTKLLGLLKAEVGAVFLYDAARGDLVLESHAGTIDNFPRDLRVKLPEAGFLGKVMESNQHLLVGAPSSDEGALVKNLREGYGIRSCLILPLRSREKRVGVFLMGSRSSDGFAEDSVRSLRLFVNRIAEVIENIRLSGQMEQRMQDLMTLQQVASTIVSEPNMERTLKTIVRITASSLQADLCAFLLADEAQRFLVTQKGAHGISDQDAEFYSLRLSDDRFGPVKVFRDRAPFLSGDITQYQEGGSALLDNYGPFKPCRSLMILPMHVESRVIGVLMVGSMKTNFFTEDHKRVAGLVADQASVIIENARLYNHIRKSALELERLNRVKDEFISLVSHELRTPLTSIKGFVSVVLNGDAGAVTPQQKKFLGIADHSIDRLALLISDVLDISRIEAGKIKVVVGPTSLGEIAERSVTNFSALGGKKKIRMTCELPPNLPLGMADPDRIQQVVDNLLSNAIKFTPENGSITVSGQDKGDYILIKVADTGMGIDEKHHDKIFEKFYQVDGSWTRSVGGTGLGLAIAKSLIELQGGKIWVESEPGKGATFHFIIPRAKDIAKEKEEAA